MHYVVLFIAVILVDLIPAFGPPAWIVAVFFRYKYHLAFAAVVLLTALATMIGRLLLALATRKFKRYLPAKYRKNLEYSKGLIARNRQSTRLAVGLFLLSPLPSAQLFEAAGLLDVRLGPLGLAFFIGRLITVSLYLGFAHLTVTSFGHILESGLGSAWTIAFEAAAVLLIVAMFTLLPRLQKLRRKR